jgi:hypothetical protein
VAKVKKKSKLNRQVIAQVDDFKRRSEIRFEIANEAYRAQDAKTRQVIDSIQNQLLIGATGTIRVYPDGVTGPSVPMKVDFEYVEYNTLYVATEILKDLALMDVKIANYKFPQVYCTDCGEKIAKKKPKAKGRK